MSRFEGSACAHVTMCLATTYAQVTRLLALLDTNTSLRDSNVKMHTRKAKSRGEPRSSYPASNPVVDVETVDYERTTKYQDVLLPELSVAAAWVMVLKMAHGLDGRPRSVLSSFRKRFCVDATFSQVISKSDPTIGLPDSKRLVQELETRLENGTFKGSQADFEKQQVD